MNDVKKSLVSRELDNYKMLDIAKYAAAILVIIIHCDQSNVLAAQAFPMFFLKNIVCRVAVPFFFMTSAYFVRKGSRKSPQYVASHLKSTLKSYLLWSLVFVPIGLDWVRQNLALADNLLPFALLYGLVHIGTYYHLWYIPAMLFSIFFVDKLLRRISYKLLFLIAAALFAFGSLESYYGLLPAGLFKDFFTMLMKIIFTTRSGLFYGMVFVLMGFFICDYQEKLKAILKYVPMLTIASAALLMLEGTLLYRIPKLDMSFLFALIPFGFFCFLWVLSFPYRPKRDTKKIRAFSKYYYFVHPVCIILVEQTGFAYGADFLTSGLVSFVLIVLLTHLLSACLIAVQTPIRPQRMLASALWGLVITFVFAGILLPFQTTQLPLKFEFVPCIWFVSSFVMCYFLSKRGAAKA